MNRESRALDYPTELRRMDAARVRASYTVDASGCWLGNNVPNDRGYGAILIDGQRLQLHRLMYVLARGPIPATWDIDHLCRTPRCVNPTHLEAVTHAENIRRSDFKSRRAGAS